jgi:hypothetical protein
MKSHNSDVLQILLEENFENIIKICVESESNELIGFCFMTIIHMIETSKVVGCEADVRQILGYIEDSLRSAEEWAICGDEISFCLKRNEVVCISDLLRLIVGFVTEDGVVL